jgi:hypothetical protein
MRSLKPAFAVVACFLVCLGLATCGTTEEKADRPVDVLLADCSASFRASSLRLLPEMVSIAQDSAAKEHVLWAGCFAGGPLRKLRWKVRVDFGEYAPGIHPGTPLAENVNQARALGLRGRLRKLILNTKQTVKGSGQLEALEVAAQAPSLSRVFLFSDAAIHEPEVPELFTASEAEIRQAVAHWAPRLSGLRGKRLVMIGVGLGEHNSKSVRAGRMLFGLLAERIGMAGFTWTQELPPGFPTGGPRRPTAVLAPRPQPSRSAA